MSELQLRCPELACTGWVCKIEEEGLWGCGECGATWDERQELDDAIREAVEKYPYRKKVYRKSKDRWNPVPLEKEPDDYEELVEQEWDDSEESEEDNFACPVSKCEGTAIYMEDGIDFDENPAHWVCDCCESMWFDKQNLMKEIDAIIEKYPYRAKLYEKLDGDWKPVEWEGDILEYCDLVEKEARDRKQGQRRG